MGKPRVSVLSHTMCPATARENASRASEHSAALDRCPGEGSTRRGWGLLLSKENRDGKHQTAFRNDFCGNPLEEHIKEKHPKLVIILTGI